MREAGLFLLVVLAACGGGGSAPPEPIQAIVSLGLVRADAPTVLQVVIENPIPRDATVELMEDPEGPFVPEAGTLPGVVANEGEFTLQVVVTPGTAPGVLAGEIRIEFKGTVGHGQRVILMLSATVETTGIELVTPSVDFGNVVIGEMESRSVVVRNPNLLTPVQVISATGLVAEFTVPGAPLPRTLQPGQTVSIQIDYVPQTLGDKSFGLVIVHSEAVTALLATINAQTNTWVPEIITEFGDVDVSSGETDWLEVDVPAHAISLSIEALTDTGVIGLLGLEGPGGKIYENDQLTGALLWSPSDEGVFTATVPNSDRIDVELEPGGGTYRFRLFMFQGQASTLAIRTIVHNRVDAVIFDGVLDLNVFLAPALGITALDALSDTRLQGILDETDRIFSQQGLRLGAITYFELTDSTFDDVTGAEFAALLEESDQASAVRMNVFFVRTAFGGGVLGVAPRVPGPQLNGTGASGVMVDFDFGSATTAGHVTGHEIGHYLGLFHTTESNGSHDIIDDTATCPANGTSAACPTVGNDYLMHWRVINADPVVTDGQGRVILGHPLVVPPPPLSILAQRTAPGPRGAIDELPAGWCGCCGK